MSARVSCAVCIVGTRPAGAMGWNDMLCDECAERILTWEQFQEARWAPETFRGPALVAIALGELEDRLDGIARELEGK